MQKRDLGSTLDDISLVIPPLKRINMTPPERGVLWIEFMKF